MSLTAHQEEKLSEALEILKVSDRLLITGSAGVGKTFLVNELVKRLNMGAVRSKTVYISAPTNKAVAVVKNKVDAVDNIQFITTHSALKMKRDINFKTGEVSFKPYFNEKYPPLKGVALLVIDEVSMLNSELSEYIETYATKNKTKVIFIGDKAQLNPVGEEESPIFLGCPKYYDTIEQATSVAHASEKLTLVTSSNGKDIKVYTPYPEVCLTEIIRQGAGNPIIDLSRNLQVISEKQEVKIESRGYMFTDSLVKIVETLATVNGTDDLKYLAWTNKEVDHVNTLVRKRIYGNSPGKVELGETIIFVDPYKEDYYANCETKVEELEVKVREFKYPSGKTKDIFEKKTVFKPITLKYYSINPKISSETGKREENIVVLHEDSQESFDKLIKSLKVMAKARVIDWGDYFNFVESFANISYNHAITIHKSQGSTYRQTIVNVANVLMNRNASEKKRLLYTAVTRTSDLLILYKV